MIERKEAEKLDEVIWSKNRQEKHTHIHSEGDWTQAQADGSIWQDLLDATVTQFKDV